MMTSLGSMGNSESPSALRVNSAESAMPKTTRGSRNTSNGESARCDAGATEVEKSYSTIPSGKAKGENMSSDD